MKADLTDILNMLQRQLALRLNPSVIIGALPPAEGIALLAASGMTEPYLNGSQLVRMQLSVNAKSHEQSAALDMLCRATEILLNCRISEPECSVTGCTLRRLPTQLGMDTAGFFLYGCSLEVRAFFPQ